jgi:hypothetical protein
VPLYQDEPFEVRVVDQDGTQLMVRTYALSRGIIERRWEKVV